MGLRRFTQRKKKTPTLPQKSSHTWSMNRTPTSRAGCLPMRLAVKHA